MHHLRLIRIYRLFARYCFHKLLDDHITITSEFIFLPEDFLKHRDQYTFANRKDRIKFFLLNKKNTEKQLLQI